MNEYTNLTLENIDKEKEKMLCDPLQEAKSWQVIKRKRERRF